MEFLYSGDFWMDVIIAAVITGVVGLVVGVLGYKSKANKVIESLKDNSIDHKNLSNDHARIENSVEYSEKLLGHGLNDIKGTITSINNTIIEKKANDARDYQNLNEKQKDIKDSITKLVQFGKEMELLNTENTVMKKEITRLNERIHDLEQKQRDRTRYDLER